MSNDIEWVLARHPGSRHCEPQKAVLPAKQAAWKESDCTEAKASARRSNPVARKLASRLGDKAASELCGEGWRGVRGISALRAKFYASLVFGRIPAQARGRAFRSNCYAISASVPCADNCGLVLLNCGHVALVRHPESRHCERQRSNPVARQPCQ
jgi:hypothetical protein